MPENVLLERHENIAILTLNRPDALNALNGALIRDMREAVATVASDRSARALVLTGEGRAFCAGADLRPEGEPPAQAAGAVGERVARTMDTSFNPMMRELYAIEKPTVAAVNGIAAGGGAGVALVTDITIAARSAEFVQVFAPRLGIVPDLGCSWQLPRRLGRARALGLALLGDRLPAEQAAAWGMIWSCVEDERLMPEAISIATRLADGPARAFALTRRAIDVAVQQGFDAHLDHERDCQRVLCAGPEFAEGLAAFREKRPPRFRDA
jgi:2-(1,2-epoxy-1,2-dihydrophenyl)acetyl-CoA isomerase